MRFTIREILSATFGLAALLIILEHAGSFSRVVSSSAAGYATAYTALTGHGAARAAGTRR